VLTALLATSVRGQPAATVYAGTCANGAPAREERYCSFFVHYNTNAALLPTIVGDLLGVTNASGTRSIGLIIAIDDYPSMPGHNLSAAAADAMNLQDFLIDDQQFDEVIVLRNTDASVENINYFLEDYLPNHADDFRDPSGQGKARLVIAYSGHGRPQTPSTQAAFILSTATDVDGSTGIYKMTNFTSDVSALAAHYFHVLTLINACFGAGIFTAGDRGAAAVPNGAGSFAITAGSPKNEVQALIPKRGSLFFDLIIHSVSNGEADPQSSQLWLTDGDGTVTPQGSLTLTLPLYNYLSGAFYKINVIQTKANSHFLSISPPYFGPVQSGMAQGGFFFVSAKPPSRQLTTLGPYLKPLAAGSPVETASVEALTASVLQSVHSMGAVVELPTQPSETTVPPGSPTPPPAPPDADGAKLPFGPLSSLKGRPDIKIFKPPAIYPIKGYDLSSADGQINWVRFAQSPRPRFLYFRALGWAGPDKAFSDNWSHATQLGIDRGAYVKFNFCLSAAEQLEELSRLVPRDAEALPIGIELVTPTADQAEGRTQLACYQRVGTATARDRILELAEAINTQWGKIPLLVGNSHNLSALTDARSDRFMIWLNAYGPQNSIGDRLTLRGSNPWTIWQYSGTLRVAGIGKKTTGEVFFGTGEQYEAFRRAGQNVALAAVQ
jgi:lysozyme